MGFGCGDKLYTSARMETLEKSIGNMCDRIINVRFKGKYTRL